MEPFRDDESLIGAQPPSSDAAVWIWCAAEKMTQPLVAPGQPDADKDRLTPKEAAMLAELLYELAGRLSNVGDDAVSRRSLYMALLLWDRWED